MAEKTAVVFAEVFPLRTDALPKLYAYRLDMRGTADAASLGRRLADRLGRRFPGHWVWSQNLIVTDHHEPKSAINDAVRDIKNQEADTFADLKGVTLERGWKADAQAQADFAADGLFTGLRDEIEPVLASMKYTLDGKATVEREPEVRGWVVAGEPALSLSIDSYLVSRQDLKTYAAKQSDPRDLIGLHVADKVPSANGTVYKGEIVDVVGRLDADVAREDLLAVARKEGSKAIIQEADEGEAVVSVGYNAYHYVVSALRIVLYPQHYRRFGIEPKNAQNATWITPAHRASLIKQIADVAKAHGLIGDAYSSETPKLFFRARSFRYEPMVRIGQGKTVDYSGAHLLDQLKQHGPYSRPGDLGTPDNPLRLGIIKSGAVPVEKLQSLLQDRLNSLGFTVGTIETVSMPGVSGDELAQAVDLMKPHQPHVLIGVLPGVDSRNDDDWTAYGEFKALTMDWTLTLVADARTAGRNVEQTADNLALSLISKTGGIPYVLASPLDYADVIAGLDIRRRRGAGEGDSGEVATLHLSGKDGRFIGCRVAEAEAGSNPAAVLPELFPAADFAGQTILIHRNGAFRAGEKEALRAHGEQIRATFYFVDVIRQGAPRLYLQAGRGVEAPGVGTVFVINEAEAFLVASSAASATPAPLHIRTEAPFTIGKALHSVFTLTLLNYGSPRRPKLPVSLHFSDKIGYLARRGVKPRSDRNGDLFWL